MSLLPEPTNAELAPSTNVVVPAPLDTVPSKWPAVTSKTGMPATTQDGIGSAIAMLGDEVEIAPTAVNDPLGNVFNDFLQQKDDFANLLCQLGRETGDVVTGLLACRLVTSGRGSRDNSGLHTHKKVPFKMMLWSKLRGVITTVCSRHCSCGRA
jgi:hypothetical protein